MTAQPTTWMHTVHAISMTLKALRPDFTETDLQEANRVLTACCLAIAPDATHPAEIKTMLTGLTNGFGDWLRAIADAILDAPIPPVQTHLLYGAFRMAEAFLFDIEGYNQPEPD